MELEITKMNFKEKVEKFGNELVADVVDENLTFFNLVKQRKINTENGLSLFDIADKIDHESFQKLVSSIVERTLFLTLNLIEDNEDLALVERETAEEKEITTIEEISDGLSGELYGKKGWLAKYSIFLDKS